MRYLFLTLLLLTATPAMAQHVILYRDWKKCLTLMVEEQQDRGSMLPMVMLINNATLQCKPEADLFAEDLKARNPGMTVRDRMEYMRAAQKQIREEIAEDLE